MAAKDPHGPLKRDLLAVLATAIATVISVALAVIVGLTALGAIARPILIPFAEGFRRGIGG